MLFARRLASATVEVTHIDVDSFFRRSGTEISRSILTVLHTACTRQDRSVNYALIFNMLQLNVVVKHKLVRMWPQPHRVHFLRALVVDIGGDQLLGERVALEQELMIVLERIQRAFE